MGSGPSLTARSSDHTGLFPEEHERALSFVDQIWQGRLSEGATVPELQPLVVMRPLRDVVFHHAVLEEKLLVAPERGDRRGARDDPANEALHAAELRGLVVAEDLEDSGVRLDRSNQLLVEVVLVGVGPAVHIVRLAFDHERPVRVFHLVSVLIEHGELHDRVAGGVVRRAGKQLHLRAARALVIRFT